MQAGGAPTIVEAPDFDPFVLGSASEKREIYRRKGNPVKVLIRRHGFRDEPIVGTVFDRSQGGVALCAPKEFPNGALIQVRPEPTSETSQWVQLEVRSARREQGEWLIGCRFTESLPWSVMLQFG